VVRREYKLDRTFLGIKRLGGCFGRFTGCAGRGFWAGLGPLPAAGGWLGAGAVPLDFASEDCVAVFLEIEEAPGDAAGGWEREGLRAGTSPDGRGAEAGLEGETWRSL
jgi:hypothetical protein